MPSLFCHVPKTFHQSSTHSSSLSFYDDDTNDIDSIMSIPLLRSCSHPIVEPHQKQVVEDKSSRTTKKKAVEENNDSSCHKKQYDSKKKTVSPTTSIRYQKLGWDTLSVASETIDSNTSSSSDDDHNTKLTVRGKYVDDDGHTVKIHSQPPTAIVKYCKRTATTFFGNKNTGRGKSHANGTNTTTTITTTSTPVMPSRHLDEKTKKLHPKQYNRFLQPKPEKKYTVRESRVENSSRNLLEYFNSVTVNEEFVPYLNTTKHTHLTQNGTTTDASCHDTNSSCTENRNPASTSPAVSIPRNQPWLWLYSSNHVMINHERVRKGIHPLIRLNELDALARIRAEDMAAIGNLFYAGTENLLHGMIENNILPLLGVEQESQHLHNLCNNGSNERSNHNKFITNKEKNNITIVVGENIARGTRIRDMHSAMMNGPTREQSILLDPSYTHMGMATARMVLPVITTAAMSTSSYKIHQDEMATSSYILVLCQVFAGKKFE